MPVPVTEAASPRRLIRDEVFQRLLDAIVGGDLLPGEQLYDAEIERWVGVSRTPVREALNQLAAMGLVEILPQRRTRVTPIDPERLRRLIATVGILIAGVVRDALVRRLGTDKHNPLLGRPMRVVVTEKPPRRPGGPIQTWVLATNDRELDADLVALGYRCRWQVELFFRWLKCTMGCRRLLSESPSGVAIQVYAALIASLLISLRTSCRPTKRTWEMIQLYLAGWAGSLLYVP